MKANFLTLILVLCLSAGLTAQENAVDNQQKLNLELPKHEVALSVGDNMFHTQIYDDGKGYGSYSLSYHYRIKKWLWCGGYVNVFPVTERNYNYGYYYDDYYYDDYSHYNYLATRISVAPSIRFSYLNKPLVTLYSAASVGWGVILSSHEQRPVLGIFFQTTFFGFSVGKKFFAGGEIGIGYKGLFCVNVGYKF